MLGAPGVGKTSLGKLLAERMGARFVSIGDQLRQNGIVNFRKSEFNKVTVGESARSILAMELLSFSADSRHEILVLECIKDPNSTYELFDMLQVLGLSFLGGIYLVPSPETRLTPAHEKNETREIRRARLEKFYSHICSLMELFSGAGSVVQVTRTKSRSGRYFDTLNKFVSLCLSRFDCFALFLAQLLTGPNLILTLLETQGVGDTAEIAFEKALKGNFSYASAPDVYLPDQLKIRGTLANAPG
eukprot:3117660-Rhodomonas_salina.1